MRCQHWPALAPILAIFASFHILLITILTPTWTNLGESSQFWRLSYDSHGKLTLVRTLTHFGDFSQSLRLSNDFHGILALTLNWTHFCDFGQSLRLSYHFHEMSTLTRTCTHFGDICQFPQLAYNDFDSHLDQFKPLTPKGAYLGKCPNCPCGSGIMVATERQIWGAIQL